MPTRDGSDPGQPLTLGAYLKSVRFRIHAESHALGPYRRLPSRVGKHVTQEEAAEAVDVSRQWYATLESGAPIRTSMRLLTRLADVLMLKADERARLFQLAIPELQLVGLRDDSINLLEAFPFMRAVAKRLWAATSEIDALAEASEQLAKRFPDVAQIISSCRLDQGIWDTHLLEVAHSTARWKEVVREVSASVVAAKDVDEAHVFPQLVQPGETGLCFQLYSAPVRRLVGGTIERCGLGRGSFDPISARVRSRRGLIARAGA